jgi:hypothetical protein
MPVSARAHQCNYQSRQKLEEELNDISNISAGLLLRIIKVLLDVELYVDLLAMSIIPVVEFGFRFLAPIAIWVDT